MSRWIIALTKDVIVADSLFAHDRVDESIHWWVERWEDKSLHWQCHCSRLTSCMRTSRQINSLIDRAMWVDESLHWRKMSLKQTHCEICFWNRDFDTVLWLISMIVQQIRRISCESEWTINSLIFDLVEWFQSFVYTRWSAHEFESFVYSRWISSREKKDECCCTNASRLDQSQ